MPSRTCPRHRKERPGTCDMGNLYRFSVLLFLLRGKGQSYGYELARELPEHVLTDARVEASALYRTLRKLEENGCVVSKWDVNGSGPARRVYALTSRGKQHLDEWITVLDHISTSMAQFVEEAGPKAYTADSNIQTPPLPQRPADHSPFGRSSQWPPLALKTQQL